MVVTFSIVIIITLTSYFFYKPIHKYRYPLYVVNGILALALSNESANFITLGFVALGFFTVVMYAGVLDKGTLQKRLFMVRAELAVLGTIYLAPHFLAYTGLMLDYIGLFNGPLTYYIGVLIGVLIAPLTITSFTFVRKRMTYKQWKNLHKLAYPVYGLIGLHLLVQQTDRFWTYVILFAMYGILKIYTLLTKTQKTIKKPLQKTMNE